VLCAATPVPVPFTVSVYAPGAVAVVVVTASEAVVTLAASVAGVSVAVIPAGAPATDSTTSPAKPPVRAAVMVLVPFWPAVTLRAAGDALRLKAGVAAAVTVSVTAVVTFATPLPLAVIVRGYAPGAALFATASTSVLVVEPAAIEAGAKVAVTPVGRPVAARVTASANPLMRVMVRPTFPAVPCVTLAVALAAVRVMAGVGTVRAKAAELALTPLPVALMLMLDVPAVAVVPTAIVAVALVAEPVSVAGEKVTVTPLGTASAPSVTVPL
jgi:hypothetical protein